MSLPFFTRLIMNLQAKHPDMNAAKKPTARGAKPIPPKSDGSSIISRTFKNVSPKIGISTMRNENCATLSFLLPSKRPVAIVVPERDKPGNTAIACPTPMMNASLNEIVSRWRGFA